MNGIKNGERETLKCYNEGKTDMQFIDLKAQYEAHKVEIDSAIQTVLDHGHFIMGPEIAELEAKLADYVGVKHCLTVSSGTHSLEIALRALGIGPGDEVVTVPFTWISTSEVICLVGAMPRFVDINPVTFNMDVSKLEAAITPKTKAIIPVSLFGQMPDFAKIREIADKYDIPVIEDGAQSFGATRRDFNGSVYRSCSCRHTQIASTSFFPAKPLGCYGDGGALFTNDDLLAAKIKAIRTHGGERRHYHTLVGTNGRFDTVQAAVLLAKMPYFDVEVKKRAEVGARYGELLSGLNLKVPRVEDGNTSVWAQYTIRIANRDEVGAKLKDLGVPTAIYYPKCLHEQPVFATLGYKWGDFPEAERASREVLSLPMSPFLTEQDQDKVVKSIKEVING